jgi:hypothetical protein
MSVSAASYRGPDRKRHLLRHLFRVLAKYVWYVLQMIRLGFCVRYASL